MKLWISPWKWNSKHELYNLVAMIVCVCCYVLYIEFQLYMAWKFVWHIHKTDFSGTKCLVCFIFRLAWKTERMRHLECFHLEKWSQLWVILYLDESTNTSINARTLISFSGNLIRLYAWGNIFTISTHNKKYLFNFSIFIQLRERENSFDSDFL